ncbi:MAG: hypothetical protein M9938_06940 [Solirubrobacterales bacterium]|nr:hypothetical protein [Solirubrobacterales bacterium]
MVSGGKMALVLAVLLAWSIGFSTSTASANRNLLVVNHSMAGVKPGMKVKRLHRILGNPRSVRYVRDEITGYMRRDRYRKLDVFSHSGWINTITTTRRSIHTRKGIRVGSTKRKLKRRYPGARCSYGSCAIVAGGGSATIGKTVTSFRIRHAKVRQIMLGFVID